MATNFDQPCKRRAGQKLPMGYRASLLFQEQHVPASNTNTQSVDSTVSTVMKLLAISQAESAGYAGACHHNSNGTIDRGWGQINSVHGFGESSYDPVACASQMWKIYYSQGLTAWTTYGGPAYLAALPAAKLAANKPIDALQPSTSSSDAGCVYSWKLPKIGPVGGESICFDVLLGGLKMGLGAFGTGVSMLALTYTLARAVPGAAEANSAARKVTRRVPGPVGTGQRAYRTIRSNGQARRRESDRVEDRERRQAHQDARLSLAQARERRQARESRGGGTVYVMDDPKLEARARRDARARADKREAERREATRRHGNPDAPPF